MIIPFPLVYAKTKSSAISFCEVWNKGQINLRLTRGANIAMRHEKSQIFTILHSLCLSSTKEFALWLWESSDFYSIKFMYHFFIFLGVKTNLPKSIWVLKIPLKNKLFLWITLHNKILTKANL
jgi:zinc-binding in reverse transcriptase